LKLDRDDAGLSVFTAIRAVDSLKVLFAPFLPETSQRLHEQLGYETRLFGESYLDKVRDELGEHQVLRYRPISPSAAPAWRPSQIEPGVKLGQPAPLFRKLDESVVESERARLGK
jgi:methionyl-tRNA synthetase